MQFKRGSFSLSLALTYLVGLTSQPQGPPVRASPGLVLVHLAFYVGTGDPVATTHDFPAWTLFPLSSLNSNILNLDHMLQHICVGGCAHAVAQIWRSEDNL